jgi:cystathionine beta-lyase
MTVMGWRARRQAPTSDDLPNFDLTDDDLRRSGAMKWRRADPDVVPAWIADLDVRPCPVVAEALHAAVDAGMLGYPAEDGGGLSDAVASFLTDRFGWAPDPERIVLTGDALVGVMLALEVLCARAPVVVPVPAYPPFFGAVPRTGRELVAVPCVTDGHRNVLDLDAIGRELAVGARAVLLTNPHNPLGRCWTYHELAALRELADRHRARVISDEVHAPLVLPGARHVPYATVDPDHHVTIIAASKAWNVPGTKCAQIITGSNGDAAALRGLPRAANRGLSSLGLAASVAAYSAGGAWLDGLIAHLDARREQFGRLLARHIPYAAWQPMEATYLAWVDARATGLPNPAATALKEGRVLVSAGSTFGPGAGTAPGGTAVPAYDGFVRVNIGTSAERLKRIVAGLARAWAQVT